ncbi:MAG: 2-oxoacid:ferredoxin oxidoreductase subunit beta [Bacteroidetes bacterium]|nr:2-oxoacid:ferredoxin oxidoreductase subunit beta [Bacteroidota bacterium]
METIEPILTAKDFVSDQEIRWCPGCGDFAVLKQVQNVLAKLNIPKHQYAFVSGIGCSSRFPYYLDTYGIHSIHGRATSLATGLKLSNPALSVWVITGDGDGLSIGGNHFIHLMRRNVDLKVLLFNNQVYGLTKGQYSPTSPLHTISKSSPLGSIDNPMNPLLVALASGASFIARTIDREAKHLQQMLLDVADHKGTALLEIYQNCHIFNDGAFDLYTDKQTKQESTIYLEDGKPMIFGLNKGIDIDNQVVRIIDIEKEGADKCLIHDIKNKEIANILVRLGEGEFSDFPKVFGLIYAEKREVYSFPEKTNITKSELKNILTKK